MRFLSTLLLAVLVQSLVFGQAPPSGSSPLVLIRATEEVRPLDYSSSKQSPRSASPGAYYAEFALTAEVTGLGPNDTVVWYKWFSPWSQSPAPQADRLTVPQNNFEGQSLSSITGTAWDTPGVYTAYVEVTVRQWVADQNHPQGGYFFNQVYSGLKTDLVVIGGPVTVGAQEGFGLNPPARDGDAGTSPVYLQFLGHHPVQLPFQAEKPQTGVVHANSGQPEGVTYEWIVPSGLLLISQPSPGTIQVGSLQGSARGEMKPRVRYKITHNGVNYDFACCSDRSPDATGVINPLYRSFTSHAPQSLVASPQGPSNGWAWTGSSFQYGWQLLVDLQVVSQLGDPMPGVHLQEQFVTTPPRGFLVNTPPVFWQTGSNGWTTAPDHLRIGLSQPYSYLVYPNQPYLTLVHAYRAGTSSPILGGPGGIEVARYTMRFWTDRIEHQP